MDSLKILCLLDVHKQKNTNGFEFSTHSSLNVDFGSLNRLNGDYEKYFFG